jgi:hypothetical protein
MATPSICPNCGSQRSLIENFCGNCGYQFRGSQGSHPTVPFRTSPQTRPTQILDDTLPISSSQPRSKKRRIIGLAVLALLLLGVLFLGMQIEKWSTPGIVNNGQGTLNHSGTIPVNGTAPVGVAPTPTPSPSPTSPPPTPTLCSPTPCVLYQAGGSNGWPNWAFSTDWRQVTNGIVISDGGGSPPSAVAPYTVPAGINFAIEAEMMTPNTGSLWWEYGVAACGATQGNNWTGYVGRIAEDYGSPPTSALLTRFSSNGSSDFGQHVFDPGTGWHTFRLEVRRNVVTFKVDGAPVVQATDEEFLPCGNQVGFYDGGGVRREVEVKSFKVIAI